jgi:hypothetical protein
VGYFLFIIYLFCFPVRSVCIIRYAHV